MTDKDLDEEIRLAEMRVEACHRELQDARKRLIQLENRKLEKHGIFSYQRRDSK